jgi:hypothetical protein
MEQVTTSVEQYYFGGEKRTEVKVFTTGLYNGKGRVIAVGYVSTDFQEMPPQLFVNGFTTREPCQHEIWQVGVQLLMQKYEEAQRAYSAAQGLP